MEVSYKIESAQNIEGTFNELGQDGNSIYQPLESFILGDFEFTFVSTSTYQIQQPVLRYQISTDPYYEVTLFDKSNMIVVSNNPNIKITKIYFSGQSLNQNSKFISNGNLEWEGSDLIWEGDTDYVDITADATWTFHEVKIVYEIIENNIPQYKIYNIDKINCIIQKKVEGESKIINTKTNPKVIYKPIFYRTYDLQNIYLKGSITQKIGINLSEYMTKVDSFYISIDGKDYSEIARNDIYVIFRIDTSVISNNTGQYHILDDNGELISSGNYSISPL